MRLHMLAVQTTIRRPDACKKETKNLIRLTFFRFHYQYTKNNSRRIFPEAHVKYIRGFSFCKQ